ncbi:MAG TPA: DUF2199 domain-containing protein [Candidatus Binatia bacterium]|jgi:hypothetical protein
MSWEDDTYVCATCGETHQGLPMSYGASAPALWYMIPPEERAARAELSSDQCIIDDHYFLLGGIYIPVKDAAKQFMWLSWVSLSAVDFVRAAELWNMHGRESEPPYDSFLASDLPGYPSTLNLKCELYTRPPGERPFILLEESDHPLAIEQRDGITLARVQEIAEIVRHGGAGS